METEEEISYSSGNWRVGNGPVLHEVMMRKGKELKAMATKNNIIEYWNLEGGIYLELLEKRKAKKESQKEAQEAALKASESSTRGLASPSNQPSAQQVQDVDLLEPLEEWADEEEQEQELERLEERAENGLEQEEEEDDDEEEEEEIKTCYDDCVIAPDGYLPNSIYLQNCRKWDRKLIERWNVLKKKYSYKMKIPKASVQDQAQEEEEKSLSASKTATSSIFLDERHLESVSSVALD